MSFFDQLFGRDKKPDVSNFPQVGYTQGGQLFGTDSKPVGGELYNKPLEVKIIGEGEDRVTYVGPVENDILTQNKQLVQDEGEIPYIYLDSEGNPTFGVGSLLSSHKQALLDSGLTQEDLDSHVQKLKDARESGKLPSTARNYPEEYQLKISRDVYSKTFEKGLSDANKVYNKFTDGIDFIPQEAVPVIKNLSYQLGPRLYKFKELKKALQNKDYNKAADEIIKSKLYEQAPNRTQRRADEIRKLAK